MLTLKVFSKSNREGFWIRKEPRTRDHILSCTLRSNSILYFFLHVSTVLNDVAFDSTIANLDSIPGLYILTSWPSSVCNCSVWNSNEQGRVFCWKQVRGLIIPDLTFDDNQDDIKETITGASWPVTSWSLMYCNREDIATNRNRRTRTKKF